MLPVWHFLAFHEALRRDLARFSTALELLAGERGAGDGRRVDGLVAHWQSYRLLLEWHHEVEDEGLFPFMRERNPALGSLLDELKAEHDQLDVLLPRVSEAVERLPQADALKAARAGFEQLGALLVPHLAAEEDHVVPVMLAWFAEQPAPPEPDATEAEGAEGQEAEGDDGEAAGEGEPVSDAFGYPWTLEGLPDEIVGLALDALPDEVGEQYPGWRDAYQRTVSAWT